jgi:RecA/RadA recombinase
VGAATGAAELVGGVGTVVAVGADESTLDVEDATADVVALGDFAVSRVVDAA